MRTVTSVRDPASMIPVVAVRDMYTGRVWSIPDGEIVFAGKDPEKCDIVIDGETVSDRHIEFTRVGAPLRVRGVGKNPVYYREVAIRDQELPIGEWVVAGRLCALAFMSADMVREAPGAEFFLGMDNHFEVSKFICIAPRNMPVVLVGGAGTGREVLAARLHRMSSRPIEGFLRVDAQTTREDIYAMLGRHERITAYVDLAESPHLDFEVFWELAKAKSTAIRLILAAPNIRVAHRVLPDHTRQEARFFELTDLSGRDDDRTELASRVLDVYDLASVATGSTRDLLGAVARHTATTSLVDLWWGSLRLAALALTGGNVKAAAERLRQWGCDEKRTTLDDWAFRLDIDTKMLRG